MNYTIFGESHGPAIGVTLTGVPAGLELDWAAIEKDMARRAPGKSPLATARKEADQVQVLSGVFEGKTTGSPLCAMIANTDTRSADYSKTRDLARPGHADYPAHVRYQGFNDYRGGGHFSGRLTAPLVFAGAIAKQILAQRGITVGAHISSIYGVNDEALEDWDTLKEVADKDFPVLNDEKGQEMQEAILEAKEEQDSVGGSIECGVFGLPAGYGSPDFGENAEGIFCEGGGLRRWHRLLPHAGLRGQRPPVRGRTWKRRGGAELRGRHQRRHHQRHATGVRGDHAPHPLHCPHPIYH